MQKRVLARVGLVVLVVLLSTGCSDKGAEQKSLTEGGMKCGAGKCGASMVDGNSLLAKKQKKILAEMRENDPRKRCVSQATSTKKLYNCLRDPRTGRLSKKCGADRVEIEKTEMKCAAGKCSSGKSTPVPKAKEIAQKPVMKCAAGKCSSGK